MGGTGGNAGGERGVISDMGVPGELFCCSFWPGVVRLRTSVWFADMNAELVASAKSGTPFCGDPSSSSYKGSSVRPGVGKGTSVVVVCCVDRALGSFLFAGGGSIRALGKGGGFRLHALDLARGSFSSSLHDFSPGSPAVLPYRSEKDGDEGLAETL